MTQKDTFACLKRILFLCPILSPKNRIHEVDKMDYRDKTINCVKDMILPMQKSNLKSVVTV